MTHKEHFTAAGEHYPSVTQVTGIFDKKLDGFYKWACDEIGEHKCCRQAAWAYSDATRKLGERIHLIRECRLKGVDIPDDTTEYECALWQPVEKFYQEAGYEPQSTESQLTSERLLLGGSSDGVGTFQKPFWEKLGKRFWAQEPPVMPQPGDLWLDDLKIKSKLDKLHPLQGVGYRLLEREINNRNIKWLLIIRREKDLAKKPEIQLKGYYLPLYEAYWDAARLMWSFLNG